MGKYKDIVDTEIQRFIKQTTYMNLDEEIARTPELQLESHFGGYPYFEEGNVWPTMKDGTPLDFIFQVFNQDEYHLPDDIKLIQFFANTSKPAWEDGYEVRIFSDINLEKRVTIEIPEGVELIDCSRIIFENRESLPHVDDLYDYLSEFDKKFESEYEDREFDLHNDLFAYYHFDVFTEEHYYHRLGGFASWVEYGHKPIIESTLLFQVIIDWEGFYVFRNEMTHDIKYVFQTIKIRT